MTGYFRGWDAVASLLKKRACEETPLFNDGQRATLLAIAERIEKNGVILADEVGMGKTRIAVAVAEATLAAGGRVALAIPPGLAFQWQDELKLGRVTGTPPVLRSVEGYLQAWEPTANRIPWFDQQIVMISHRFANWKLGPFSKKSRYELLPLLYAYWYRHNNNRFPKNSHWLNGVRRDETVSRAAETIFTNTYERGDKAGIEAIDRIATGVANQRVMQAEDYNRHTPLRGYLEQAVGLGLGTFDLIIIDEAHKSRGHSSGLERLVERMIIPSSNARRLAITATPVELDVSQWEQILKRIGIHDTRVASDAVKRYAEAVKKLRHVWQTSDEARREFAAAAVAFQDQLSPFVLRRDKRQDAAVLRFVEASGKSYDSYRHENEISVSTRDLTPDWRQAICAAEALGFVARADDGLAKRLRLTIGNGHAISALLDQAWAKEEADRLQEQHDRDVEKAAETSMSGVGEQREKAPSDNKRTLRVQWWQDVMASSFRSKEGAIFQHPAILAAVVEIEKYSLVGQKTLVFGRYTKPLQAITALLNARAMLRAIADGTPWPQSVIQDHERAAVEAAHEQLKLSVDLRELDRSLASQYHHLEQTREQFRSRIFEMVAEGLGDNQVFERALLEQAVHTEDARVKPLLARALDDLVGSEGSLRPSSAADGFVELVGALRDRTEDAVDPRAAWTSIEARIIDEYQTGRGTFARLMYGNTSAASRRTMQLAFNRQSSFPTVLVAQSMVGREGLNLHRACRAVVLLHPEWNPAVVEQQIGRVDRIGSKWANDLEEAIQDGQDLPHIEVRPVVFSGTYDEHNWNVLQARWRELRAQLHGVIVDPRQKRETQFPEIAQWLEKAAPNFSP